MEANSKSNLFLKVIDANKGILYKVANAYCKDADDRKDLIQEIIFQLWRSFQQYNDAYKHSTWMYRIALNVAISFYRKEHRRQAIATPLTDELLHIAYIAYDTEIDRQITQLHYFIAGLKELDKALMLLYLEQKSHKEIAGILGISETNVATRIGRVKTLLKQKFIQ